MSDDPVMARITAAISRLHAGDREGARDDFARIWSEMGDAPDPFHVCTLSHYMADTHDDVAQELEWDLRALAAAREVTDGRARRHHASLSIRSFFPSLQLNVADAWLRAGDRARASEHLAAAQDALADVPDSPLGELIRQGIAGLAQRLHDS
jgi:hypothetical protein